jgi:inosose dehydratase
MLSRRQFLGATLAATGLGWARSVLSAQEPYGRFTVGVQSYSFREFDLEQCLKRTSELGLHWIEFYSKHAPPDSKPEQIEAIKRLCSEYRITPIAFGVQGFSKNHDANKRMFDFGKALGVKYFSADPDPDSFDSLDKLCEQYGIGIAIHPHGPIGRGLHRWYSAEIIMAAVKDRHPLIGSCLDTGHLIRCAQLGMPLDPAEQVRVMGKRNFGLHLKDHDNERKTDVVLGKGSLKVQELVKALKDVDFRGWISLEYEANPKNPSPDMAACLEVLRQAIKDVG